MSKYINVEEIEKVIHDDVPLRLLMTQSLNRAIKNGIEIARIISEKAKPADVVTVVRCKDCRYAKKSETVLAITDYRCLKMNITCLDADDFCSYGERKENND